MSAAFFYGVLMHPKILLSVISNDGSHLKLCPAVLHDFTCHKVKDADYPGIILYSRRGKILFKDCNFTEEEQLVRGIMVTGLTEADMAALDLFEGTEYVRQTENIGTLGPLTDVSDYSVDQDDSLVPAQPPPLPSSSETTNITQAETYVYVDEKNLMPELWSFDDFVKNSAKKWYGLGANEGSASGITEADRRAK